MIVLAKQFFAEAMELFKWYTIGDIYLILNAKIIRQDVNTFFSFFGV